MPQDSKLVVLRPPQDDDELWEYVRSIWGIAIPRLRVCPHHKAPFEAFADAFFARHPVTVIKASRGFGGKSQLVAILAVTNLTTLGADVGILGGSGEQSKRVIGHMAKAWSEEHAPRELLASDPGKSVIQLINGAQATAQTASQKSVRGPHPQRLLIDEVDEVEMSILEAALGQPMSKKGITANTVLASTHQYADGTMTWALKHAPDNDWGVYEWCLPAGELVLDGAGCPVTIESLQVGDAILSGSGQRRGVTQTWKRAATDGVMAIKVVGLPHAFRVTPQHRILTAGGWRRAYELSAGDEVLTPILPLRGDPSRTYMEGRIVGLYLAEGCRGGGGHGVQFGIHAREVSDVIALLESWWPAREKWTSRPRAHVRGNGATVSAHHPALIALLEEFVTGNDAASKRLTTLALHEPFAQGVLDGYLAGDGSRIRKAWKVDTASRALAFQMMLLAGSLGFATSLWTGINRPGPMARSQGKTVGNPFWRLTIAPYTTGRQQPRPVEGGWYRQIESVATEPFEGDVYDVTVPLDHSFMASGVTVSNCYRENLEPHGWLPQVEVDRKRKELPAHVFAVEIELQEPAIEGRAIVTEKVEAMFDKELGTFRGSEGEYVEIEAPSLGHARYVHGVDWARKTDYTVIVTLRIDCTPMKIVAFGRYRRRPWPEIVSKLVQRLAKYGGYCIYDQGGIGDAVVEKESLTNEIGGFAEGVWLQGKERYVYFSEYIAAIERGELVGPRIDAMYTEHKFVTTDDIWRTGEKFHTPDTFVAGACAYRAAMLSIGGDVRAVNLSTNPRPRADFSELV